MDRSPARLWAASASNERGLRICQGAKLHCMGNKLCEPRANRHTHSKSMASSPKKYNAVVHLTVVAAILDAARQKAGNARAQKSRDPHSQSASLLLFAMCPDVGFQVPSIGTHRPHPDSWGYPPTARLHDTTLLRQWYGGCQQLF